MNYKSPPKLWNLTENNITSLEHPSPLPQQLSSPALNNYLGVSTSVGLILGSGNFFESTKMYFGGIIFVNGMKKIIIFREY